MSVKTEGGECDCEMSVRGVPEGREEKGNWWRLRNRRAARNRSETALADRRPF